MPQLSPFGEQSLTLVAATFSDQVTAAGAATELRADMPQVEVDLVHPGDEDFARRMEPESRGIRRTAVRSHLVLARHFTLRPDRSRVTLSIGRGNRAGQWAVVAHPTNPAQSDRVVDWLEKAGGKVIRSL